MFNIQKLSIFKASLPSLDCSFVTIKSGTEGQDIDWISVTAAKKDINSIEEFYALTQKIELEQGGTVANLEDFQEILDDVCFVLCSVDDGREKIASWKLHSTSDIYNILDKAVVDKCLVFTDEPEHTELILSSDSQFVYVRVSI
jgi:hypothetical protein